MDLVGQNLGQYRIVEPVGAGGMATVYKAYQPGLDRDVAIKVLPAQHALTPGFKERFFREAKAVAQLSHPNILPIYDVGIENDISYFVMKYVPGRTLKDVMGQSLPLEAVCDYMDQLGGALDHAHKRGILHRDIKPVNVLLEDDWLLLADFGLAKIVEGTEALTATGSSMGTPAYVSPEQAVGKPVDHRTDIYSVGVVLYEMATGQVPYSGETPMGVMFKHVYEPLPLPRQVNPNLPEAVERVILKALAKNPDDRFDRAGDLARTLRQAVESGPTGEVGAPPPIAAPTAEPPPSGDLEQTVAYRPEATSPAADVSQTAIGSAPAGRNIWLWLGGGAIVLILLGGGIAFFSGLGNSQSSSGSRDLIMAEAPGGDGSAQGVALLPSAVGEATETAEAFESETAVDTPAPPAEAVAAEPESPPSAEEPAEAVAAEPESPPSAEEPAEIVSTQPPSAAATAPPAEAVAAEPQPATPEPRATSDSAVGPRSFDDVPTISPATLLGRGPIGEITVSPDDQTLAVVSSKSVWLYDLPSLELIGQLDGPGNRLTAADWSPDSKLLAVGTADGPVRIWDAATGNEDRLLAGHTAEVLSVAWSPDGTQVAAGSEDASIRVWDVSSSQELVKLTGHLYEPYSLAWAPEGDQIASASRDTTIRVWDLASGGELQRLEGHLDEVNSIEWSPDGERLLSGSNDLTIRVWDTTEWREENILSGHTGWVVNATWSPDGTRIASGGLDGTVRIWEADAGEQLAVLEGHSQPGVAAVWLGDGEQVVSGGIDGTIRLWDVAAEEELARISDHTALLRDVAWSPDGSQLAAVGFDGLVHLWNIAEQTEVQAFAPAAEFLLSVTWSPDGAQLATGNTDGIVKLWNIAGSREVAELAGHADAVSGVAWSPNARQLASGSVDGTIRLWDPVSGASLRELSGHGDAVNGLVWSPDGSQLASGSDDRTIIIWDADSGSVVRQLEGRSAYDAYQYYYAARGPNWIKSVDWSPDGKRLVAGSSDYVTRLWDSASGAELRMLEGPAVPVLSVTWAPDSQRLAMTGVEGRDSITVWNAMQDQPLYRLNGHVDTVYSTEWSPDGSQLASVGNDGLIHIWQIPDE